MIDTWLKHIVYEYALSSVFDRCAMQFSDIDIGVYIDMSYMYSIESDGDEPSYVLCFAIWWSVDLSVIRDGNWVTVIGTDVTSMHYEMDRIPLVITTLSGVNFSDAKDEDSDFRYFTCKLSDLYSMIVSVCSEMS